MLFIIQFSISVAALAIGNNQQDSLASSGWCRLSDPEKNDIQSNGFCFGFQDVDSTNFNASLHVNSTASMTAACMGPGSFCPTGNCVLSRCSKICFYCSGCFVPGWTCQDSSLPLCQPCYSKLKDSISLNLRRGGGVSLAFAFTEVVSFSPLFESLTMGSSSVLLRPMCKLQIT